MLNVYIKYNHKYSLGTQDYVSIRLFITYMYNNYLWLDLVQPSPVNLVSSHSGVVIRSVNVVWLVVSSHTRKHTHKHLLFLLDEFIRGSFLEPLDELHRYVPTHVVHNILFPEC